MVEAAGVLLLNNIWADYTRILISPLEESWALLSKDNGAWDEVVTGYEADRVLSDLREIINKTLGGRAHRGAPPYVSWLRVTEVED